LGKLSQSTAITLLAGKSVTMAIPVWQCLAEVAARDGAVPSSTES
jgi:hypothetical protein